MKNPVKIVALVIVICFSIATSAVAGSRYFGPGFHHHRPFPHPVRVRNHYHGPDPVWAIVGATVLTGALIGALAQHPPYPPQRVVYRTPRRLIVQTPPQRFSPPDTMYTERPELILRQVETTAQLLNIRNIPDVESDITGQLRRGALLDVIGAAPEWLYVKTSSGWYGWVMEHYTRPAGEPVG